MDTVTTLIGNKIFSSVYDPNIDKLAQDYRSNLSTNLGSLDDAITKAADTQNILSKVPGVSDETKNEIENLLKGATSYTKDAATMTPSAVAAKKDEVALKMKALEKKAKAESKAKAQADAAAKAKAEKDAVENRKFSITRLFQRAWDRFKWYFLIGILVILALWGGSMSSNAAIKEPVYIRLYYLIYGSLLFPVSYAFAIKRHYTGEKGAYYAILAPLLQEPVSRYIKYLFYPFIYTPPGMIMPLPIMAIADPQHNSEQAVLSNQV
jgi:hypothetical protein